jgi:hypothetical protein
MKCIIAVIVALAIPATASAAVSQEAAVKTASGYASLRCGEGFGWTCVNDHYLPTVCRLSAGHTSWFCTGVVREGVPNRITVVTTRVRRRDGDVLIRTFPGPRLGQDIVG